MEKILLVALLTLLAGCSTQPVNTEQASVVPPDRVWDKKATSKTPDTGVIIVKRDSGFIGSACLASVYLDGNPIADLSTREKVTLYAKPGRHILSATPHGWCAGGMVEVGADVILNKTLIYRIGYGANGDYRFSPTAF
ncbi:MULTISPECIES: hypothetical protein [Enterobacteriaceae]|uniref:hypothetical protein n=1 Tax=Enterobacteriaceae TaxID=543 RepID=UPI001090D048|nr:MULTISPECIES: hypothetical protein [Enterobacteriaceae]HDP7909544.1 hypothetical protein [Escherichia coli]HEC5300571.1 hypothetical protein [Enterobacter asburiae]MDM7905443.1 hypothetical protein [Klebsiella pneumoniae]HAS1199295.1 hypothetical protein [Enterobacter cloacae]HBR1545705.1 hypothetical protein [Klebsiella pneumoniae]